jgi:hypothetical protein
LTFLKIQNRHLGTTQRSHSDCRFNLVCKPGRCNLECVEIFFFFVLISDVCLYRYYKGKRFTYFAMAKDAEFESVGTSSMQGQIVWSQSAKACVITGTGAFRWGILTNLFVDLSLLCIMFVGVLRKRNATYLWKILYFQSLFWILTAIFTEVPCVVRRRCLDFLFCVLTRSLIL